MISILKSIFVNKPKEKPLVDRIEIKEMPANSWWSQQLKNNKNSATGTFAVLLEPSIWDQALSLKD